MIGVTLLIAGLFPIYLMTLSIRLRPQREALYKEMRAILAEWKPEWSTGPLQDQTEETASVISTMTIAPSLVSLAFGFFAFVDVREGAWAGLVCSWIHSCWSASSS